jgi:hypothetical protein
VSGKPSIHQLCSFETPQQLNNVDESDFVVHRNIVMAESIPLIWLIVGHLGHFALVFRDNSTGFKDFDAPRINNLTQYQNLKSKNFSEGRRSTAKRPAVAKVKFHDI